MALLPPRFLKSVVSIELSGTDDEIKPIGTGFIYSDVLKQKDDGQVLVQDYLVTAKHVVYKEGVSTSSQKRSVSLRFDKLGEDRTQIFILPLYNEEGLANFFIPLEDIDVAVIPFNGSELEKNNIDFTRIFNSQFALSSSRFDEIGLSAGDEVFFLGFPLGIRGEERNYAICRSGTVARLDRESLKNYVIYLDAPVFPGNSGGPVFCKPQIGSIEGTKVIDRSFLLGIATHYLSKKGENTAGMSEEDIAKMEGHLGLSKIVTVDAIELAIKEHKKRFQQSEETGS